MAELETIKISELTDSGGSLEGLFTIGTREVEGGTTESVKVNLGTRVGQPIAMAFAAIAELEQKVYEMGFSEMVEDGLAFVDEEFNIGVLVDSQGIHSPSIVEYQIDAE